MLICKNPNKYTLPIVTYILDQNKELLNDIDLFNETPLSYLCNNISEYTLPILKYFIEIDDTKLLDINTAVMKICSKDPSQYILSILTYITEIGGKNYLKDIDNNNNTILVNLLLNNCSQTKQFGKYTTAIIKYIIKVIGDDILYIKNNQGTSAISLDD